VSLVYLAILLLLLIAVIALGEDKNSVSAFPAAREPALTGTVPIYVGS
jgi:hypothetical protein